MAQGRCAVHPARPAVDECPTCGRARCGRDLLLGERCAACATPAQAPSPARTLLEVAVRASLGALPVALAAAAVVSEYVGAGFLGVATPFLLGIGCAAGALAAARPPRSAPARRVVTGVAVLYAFIGTAYSFRFVVGGDDPFGAPADVLPPYAAAVAGAWLWTLPPRRRPQPQAEEPEVDQPVRGTLRK